MWFLPFLLPHRIAKQGRATERALKRCPSAVYHPSHHWHRTDTVSKPRQQRRVALARMIGMNPPTSFLPQNSVPSWYSTLPTLCKSSTERLESPRLPYCSYDAQLLGGTAFLRLSHLTLTSTLVVTITIILIVQMGNRLIQVRILPRVLQW